jgi:hypothetical protein
LALGGYLFLYGIGGSKSVMMAIVLLPLLYLWLNCFKKNVLPVFVWGLSAVLMFGLLLKAAGFHTIAYWYVAVVHMRTFSIPAQMMAQFYKFFDQHPLTYLSHAKGFSIFITNPYGMDIPRTVGTFFYGSPVGANSGFWAGDGIAGFGLPGIIIMSSLCAMLFWLFDNLCRRLDPCFVIIAAGFLAISFTNTSLFTTLSSGGLGLLMLAVFVLPDKGILQCAFRPAPLYLN